MNTQLDTQELEYSLDLSSSFSNEEQASSDASASNNESEDSVVDLDSLKPYEFEPTIEYHSSSSGNEEEEKEHYRAGNMDWCMCGKCKAMENETESLCCLDTNEVPDNYFEGKLKL